MFRQNFETHSLGLGIVGSLKYTWGQTMDAVEQLFTRSLDQESVRADPISPGLTIPRTWGVYKIEGSDCGPSGKRYRHGNHPIRRVELERDFGKVAVVAVMPAEELATQLELQMNLSS